MLRFPWVRLAAAAAAALLLSSLPATSKTLLPDPVPDAWQRPHADGGNTGFANVVTRPAVKPSLSIGHIGAFGVGAGPVIGPDGTVYVGTLQGKLLAFHPDGTRAWDRQLDAGQSILASPVVASDGSIFVVSQSIFTDTRVDPPFTRPDSTLHKFLPGGGYAWKMPFPESGTKLDVPNGSGGTDAAPNIWRYNGEEAVIVPVFYRSHTAPTREVRLLAFSASGGAVLGDAQVEHPRPDRQRQRRAVRPLSVRPGLRVLRSRTERRPEHRAAAEPPRAFGECGDLHLARRRHAVDRRRRQSARHRRLHLLSPDRLFRRLPGS